jgi:hypothetical protein
MNILQLVQKVMAARQFATPSTVINNTGLQVAQAYSALLETADDMLHRHPFDKDADGALGKWVEDESARNALAPAAASRP